jgi:hypothetical protein
MFQPHISWSGRMLIALTYWGHRLSDSQKLPTNLAHLSVIGARIALNHFASVEIAQEFVDASLVGSGIGDADTGIEGVYLCWWNADGWQCYGCCGRHAHYCPLHQLFLF